MESGWTGRSMRLFYQKAKSLSKADGGILPSGNITKMTRLMKLVAMMRDKRYPNHRTLQRALKLLDSTCTFSISQKTIQRLEKFFEWIEKIASQCPTPSKTN